MDSDRPSDRVCGQLDQGRPPKDIDGMTLITYNDWYQAGRSRSQLKRAVESGSLRRVRRGVLAERALDPKPETELQLRTLAAADFLGTGTAFSHYSAAVLHGLPLFAQRQEEVTVVRSAGGHGVIRPTIHARSAQLPAEDVVEIDGLRVTSLARTVSDLIRLLPFQEAVMLLDRALALGLDPAELYRRTRSGRGCRMAARAIDFANGTAESPGESLSRVRMHEAGLVMPVLQYTVLDGDGRFVGRSDFYWEHAHTVGEFDGQVKYTTLAPTQAELDAVKLAEERRQRRIEDTGVRVVRWTWTDLWDGTMANRLRPIVGTE